MLSMKPHRKQKLNVDLTVAVESWKKLDSTYKVPTEHGVLHDVMERDKSFDSKEVDPVEYCLILCLFSIYSL